MARMRDKSKENCAQDTQNYIPPDNVYQCFASRAYHSVVQRGSWVARSLSNRIFISFFYSDVSGNKKFPSLEFASISIRVVFSHKYKTFYFFIAFARSRLSCGYFITPVYIHTRGNPLPTLVGAPVR